MTTKPRRVRADLLLVERGLAATRTQAQALILAGEAWLGDARVGKPGASLPRTDTGLMLCPPE